VSDFIEDCDLVTTDRQPRGDEHSSPRENNHLALMVGQLKAPARHLVVDGRKCRIHFVLQKLTCHAVPTTMRSSAKCISRTSIFRRDS